LVIASLRGDVVEVFGLALARMRRLPRPLLADGFRCTSGSIGSSAISFPLGIATAPLGSTVLSLKVLDRKHPNALELPSA
jgi:hypothetical protein